MPNHITNKLTINGPSHLIERIIGSETDTDQDDYQLDFKKTVPHPPEAESNEQWDWYNWQVNNWGTKWNAYETVINYIHNDSAELNFQTAWSPPSAWLKTTVEMFPLLTFRLSWVDEDYPSSGLLIGSNGIYSDKYFGRDDEALDFVKEEWPDLYEMYEKDRAIDNLQTELTECIQEFYPNINIEIVDYNENDEGINEPSKINISCHNPSTNGDIWSTLDKSTQRKIIKKLKEILLEHGYKSKLNDQELILSKIESD